MCREEGVWQLGMKCCRQYVPAAEIQGRAVSPRGRRTRKGGGELGVKMRVSQPGSTGLEYLHPHLMDDLMGNRLAL